MPMIPIAPPKPAGRPAFLLPAEFTINELHRIDQQTQVCSSIIGQRVVRNLSGFGCRILAYDQFPNETVKPWATYVDGPIFAQESDIITLHGPLIPDTHHILNEQTLPYLKDGVFIVNTSRGALLDTAKVIRCLKSGKIGYLAIDVYEEEADYFYRDLSDKVPTNLA